MGVEPFIALYRSRMASQERQRYSGEGEQVTKRSPRGGGSVRLRRGSKDVWRIRYPSRSGKQKEVAFRGSKSAADAEKRRLLVAEGMAPAQESSRTVGELLDEWLTHLQSRGRSPRTLAEN